MSSPIAAWSPVLLGCVLVIAGCDRAKEDAPAASSAPESPPASEPTASAKGACAALAQALCERTPITCESASTLLGRAQPSEADCSAAHEDLVVADTLGPDMRGTVQVAVLADLMKKSPVVEPADVDALLADANARARAAVDADASSALLGDSPCPGIATKKGARPPAGDEVWCETKDGKRHGPAAKWNAAGELVRTAEYRDGAIESVQYLLPASGDLPMALFVCPAGEKLVEETQGELEIRACDLDGHRGTTAQWKAGKLVAIEVPPRPGDPAENRFVGYMNQPE